MEESVMKIRQVYWHIDESENIGGDNFKYCPLCGELLVEKNLDNRARQTCPGCGFIHFRNPSPTVSLLIIDGNNVLLGKRSQFPRADRWATPSGYIEFDEDFLTTATREAKEETNLDIEIIEILDVTDSFFPPQHHFLNIYILAGVIGGQLQANDDMAELRWFPLDGPLPEMAFEEDINLINRYIKQRR